MIVNIPVNYYQQYDADYSLDVPAEGQNGWKRDKVEFNLSKTALTIMHAWDCGTPNEYPGWYRYVEYLPRANDIAADVFPPLVENARKSPMQVFHVVSSGKYW